MALAPSDPISLYSRLRLVNALLNNQTNGQNQTELSKYASDQHETKSSVMGSSRRVHLRLRERGGNGLGAPDGQDGVRPGLEPAKHLEEADSRGLRLPFLLRALLRQRLLIMRAVVGGQTPTK